MLFPLQRMREMEKMLTLAGEANPKVVMEIGDDKCCSLYHWVKAFSPEVAIAIEFRGLPFADSFRRAFPQTEQFYSEESSYDPETVGAVRAFLAGRQIDVLFIDGD